MMGGRSDEVKLDDHLDELTNYIVAAIRHRSAGNEGENATSVIEGAQRSSARTKQLLCPKSRRLQDDPDRRASILVLSSLLSIRSYVLPAIYTGWA